MGVIDAEVDPVDVRRTGQHKPTITAARSLRTRSTAAERRLWAMHRRRRLDGLRFRRQHPLGPFVLDFYCAAARLGIEVDGGVHDGDDQRCRDTHRAKALTAQGIEILRFSNDDVTGQLHHVLKSIAEVARGRLRHNDPNRS